ncbi:hypothetical protein B0H12DRAFT_94489 [Mycena haematopus]|nr:hypothetical protein B0H12DRAFT_94489 [Mycena haematopus]
MASEARCFYRIAPKPTRRAWSLSRLTWGCVGFSLIMLPGAGPSYFLFVDWQTESIDGRWVIQREGIHTITDALTLVLHPQIVQVSQLSRPRIAVNACSTSSLTHWRPS